MRRRAADFGGESTFTTIEALLESGNLAAARDEFELLSQSTRARIECHELEAQLLWKEQRLDELDELLIRASSEVSTPRQRWFIEMYTARLAEHRGQPRAALERIAGFLSQHGNDLSPQQRAQGHAWMAIAWIDLRCMESARAEFDRALHIHEMLGDLNGVARIMNSLGGCERFDGRWDKATAMYEHAIRCFEKVGDPRGIGVSCGRLGALRLFRGHFNSAASSLQRALLLGRETGDYNLTIYQCAIGLLYIRTGSPNARSYLARLFWETRRNRLARSQALTCEYLGELALSEGRWRDASMWLHRAMRIAEPAGLRDVVGESMCRLAEVDLGVRNACQALGRIESCLADFESMRDVYEVSVCKRVRGQVLLALGRTVEAREDFDLALKFLDAVGELFESARVRRLLIAAECGTVIWDIRAAVRGSVGEWVDYTAEHSDEAKSRTHSHRNEVQGCGQTSIEKTSVSTQKHHPEFPRILGVSPVLLETLELVRRCAPSNSPVLIEGETGTGKELLAKAIHDLSPRSEHPFVPFNCGTSTPEVFDAEICGHVRGAFTGAHVPRAGLVRAAEGGTLFLDEVAELNPSIQPRLLRLLDIGEIRPVGSDEVLQSNIRVVAATHQDMDAAVQSKRFRSDLFYRLCTFRVRVPALRDRLDDLPILVEHFVNEARRNGYPSFAGVSTTIIGKMAKYHWPGNLRELRNEVIRLAQRSNPGEKARTWISPSGPTPSPRGAIEGKQDWERDHLITELRMASGSVAEAARRMGVSRARVYRLLKQWDIDLNSYRD